MPRYTFECRKCGEIVKFISYEDYDPRRTPNCDCGRPLRRVIDKVRIQFGFKGSTRYRDPLVERGLRYEREKFGAPLTDEAARKFNAQRGL